MVRRYRETVYGHEENSWTEMQESEHGMWVDYTDYAALAERCERLQFELQETVRQWDEMAALCSFWKEQAETLGYVHPEERESP